MYMNMRILMNMNIYITKDNEEHLRTVKPSMSGYINGLIELDRGVKPFIRDEHTHEHVQNIKKNVDGTLSVKDSNKPFRSQIIKTPADALDRVKGVFGEAKELCKVHGTPLDARGKCLQKGCKYA